MLSAFDVGKTPYSLLGQCWLLQPPLSQYSWSVLGSFIGKGTGWVGTEIFFFFFSDRMGKDS